VEIKEKVEENVFHKSRTTSF